MLPLPASGPLHSAVRRVSTHALLVAPCGVAAMAEGARQHARSAARTDTANVLRRIL